MYTPKSGTNYDVNMTFRSPAPSGLEAHVRLPSQVRVVVRADNAAQAVQDAVTYLEEKLQANGGVGHDIFLLAVNAAPRKLDPYQVPPYISKLEEY